LELSSIGPTNGDRVVRDFFDDTSLAIAVTRLRVCAPEPNPISSRHFERFHTADVPAIPAQSLRRQAHVWASAARRWCWV